MIEIRNLTRKFDHFIAVDDLSFTVKEGEVLGFLGPQRGGQIHHHEGHHRLSGRHRGQRYH